MTDEMKGPPYDGKPCPMCPSEIRNLSAVSHNLLNRWDQWKNDPHPEFFRAVAEHMEELRHAVAAVEPLADAHFADRKHSHPD